MLLDIATLGLNSLRDGIYEEVARGTHERASTTILGYMTGGVAAITLFVSALPWLRIFRSAAPKQAETKARIGRVLALLLLASAFVITVQYARVLYITRAANHAEQLQRVVGPFMSESERLRTASRLAQIRSQKQYIELIAELSDLAKRNGAAVPSFDMY